MLLAYIISLKVFIPLNVYAFVVTTPDYESEAASRLTDLTTSLIEMCKD
jgi:hypothetical protein